MTEINLDAARAARLEQAGERSFVFKGERFALPDELPYDVLGPIALLAVDDRNIAALRDVMVAVLGVEEHGRFEALRPSLADVNELVGALMDEYGMGAPAGEDNGAPDPLSAT